MRVLLVVLALALAGCLPVAVLRTPEPVSGRSLALGLSAVGLEGGVALLPYAAYAEGNGQTEYSFSVQMGFRAGIKQALAPGLSLDMGLTLPPVLGGDAVPLALDAGLLLGLGGVYLSPRVHWIGFQSQNTRVSGLLYQATLGYAEEGFLGEGSVLFHAQGGAVLFVVSAAVRL
ncbi:hypothetical protein [Thermus altitudinis]|uniref:hypothetical protein n=1 Tax=Thermus altitudinis TaxID=2908145 RepID=UPI001FAA579A|nr:hypothetical protein [Thermus altitudinis]